MRSRLAGGWDSTSCISGIRLRKLVSRLYSGVALRSASAFVMGCGPIWVRRIKRIGIVNCADLELVHDPRPCSLPGRVDGTERHLPADSILHGCCAPDVFVSGDERSTTDTRVVVQDECQPD